MTFYLGLFTVNSPAMNGDPGWMAREPGSLALKSGRAMPNRRPRHPPHVNAAADLVNVWGTAAPG